MFSLFNKNEKIDSKKSILHENNSLRNRLNAVSEISEAMTGVTNKTEVLNLITGKLVSVIGVSWATVFEWNESSEELTVSSITIPSTVKIIAERALGNAISSFKLTAQNTEHLKNDYIQCILQNEIIRTDRLSNLSYPMINEQASSIIQSILGMKLALSIPLTVKGKKLGVLGIIWKKNNLTEEENKLILTFAGQISNTIYNARLFNQVQEQIHSLELKNKDLQSLYQLTSEISKYLDPAMVSKSAIENIPNDDNLLAEIIFLHDKENKKLVLEAYPETEYAEKARAILGQDFKNISLDLTKPGADKNPGVVVLNTMKPLYGKDFRSTLVPTLPGPVATALSKLIPIKSYAIYPIVSHNKALGIILYLFRNEDTIEKMDSNTKQLLYTYALQIGISLDNANLFEHSQVIQLNLKKALNELTEARRQERDMIDVMGHELRTPITIVRNALQLMELAYANEGNTIDKKQTSEYLSMALESTKREMVLIETMLTATKVDASRIQLSQEKVDMLDVIHDGLEGQRPAANNKNIQLIWDQPEGDFFAYADRVRVQEIMDNFISNSVKYTQKGFIEVKIEKKNDKIIVKIKDSGMGIDKSDIENLGKKFFRAKQYINGDESIVRPGGTGLGLYVVFGLIKAMNGEVTVDSKVGEGSTFSFSLPAYTGQKEVKYNEKFLVNDNKKSILKIGGYQKKLESMEKTKSMDSIVKETEDMKHKVEEDNEKILNPK